MGVKRWGSAKDVILKGIVSSDPSRLRPSEGRGKKEEQLNAETQSAQRVRGHSRVRCVERAGWKPMFTVHVTASHDNVSSYFLYSNYSNEVRLRCKLIRGMGMRGNLVRENGYCVRSG
jgi:hypothetical protein